MSILTSPDPIVVHPEDKDSLFFNFVAHLASNETLDNSIAPTYTSEPTGLIITNLTVVAAPNDAVVEGSYGASPAGTYDVLVRATTSNGRTLHRTFVVKVRDY